MKARKYLALLLAMAMCLSLLAGCGSSSSSSTGDSSEGSASSSSDAATSDASSESGSGSESTSTGTARTTEDGRSKVIVGTTNNAGSFDPMLADNANNRLDEIFLVYEKLIYQDGDCNYYPQLAQSWEMTSDSTCEVVLYENIYDSEGNHITSSDVKFCFDTLKAASINTVTDLASCEIVDDYTVIFTTEEEDPPVGTMESCLAAIWIVSQDAYEASEDQMATTPVGTGAYIMTDFQSGSSLTFEVNENYWNKDGDRCPISVANVDVIEFQIIGDKSQVALALQTGTIDISDCAAAGDAGYFEDGGEYADDFTIEAVEKNLVLWLCFNCSDSSPMSNINLRKAIAYCFNTADIIDGAEDGYATEVHSFFSTYSDYYNTDWDSEDYYDYDPDVAQEYLDVFTEETGIAVSDLDITILANSNNSSACELLGAYLSVLGISYTLDMLDQSVVSVNQTDETAWDLFMNERSTFSSEMKKTYQWFSVTANSYGSTQFIEDDTLEDLLRTASFASTSSAEATEELNDYITEQCYTIGLYQRQKNEVYANWISNIQHTQHLNIAINACTFASYSNHQKTCHT
ncbi:MAG: ABC transporter substrate-binding protein [Clostridiales bacterium]|nr:ABC transporter substrate-binding protein [Clostridiales bacterium]